MRQLMGWPLLAANGGAHHIGGGADGGGVAADVGAQRQRPRQCGQGDTLRRRQAPDNGNHGGGKGNVVNKGTGHGAAPEDDNGQQEGVPGRRRRQ